MRTLLISVSILAFTFSLSHAQNLDKILEAHYKAAAQEKVKKINTIVTTGKNKYAMAGIESTFTLYQARPNKLRVQAEFQGSQVIQTYNGETGWMYAPAMGITAPQQMSNDELQTILKQAEFESPLWNYKEKGSTLEMEGTTEDGAADLLQLTSKDGNVMHLGVDRKSHLITSIKTTRVLGGSEAEIEINMKDYKSVKGIPAPHYIVTKMGGEILTTVNIESIKYNQELDPALFEKPVIE